MHRRTVLANLGAAAACSLLPAAGVAQTATALTSLRIGYQKNGVLLVAKQQRLFETRFAALGLEVSFHEFAFGPPLLEALSAGSLDYGTTGDAPPIFAQAARAKLYYAASLPARGEGQAIIVPPESPIKTLADLRGRKVGVAKASSAHNLLIAALEAEGIGYDEITPLYLAPADAASAYARGAIDAWSIWDPYYAIAELSKTGARRLPIRPAAQVQNSFFLSNRGFTDQHPEIVTAINEELAQASLWIEQNRDAAARLFAEATGVSLEAQSRTVARAEFKIAPLSEAVIAQQQAVADRFFKLGLIPKPITVRDIVWTGQSAA